MRIGELIEVRKGKKPELVVTESRVGYRRLIQIDDLRHGASPKYCPATRDEVTARETDVVIAWDGANAGTSTFGLSGVIGSTLAVLRPTCADICTPYLGHFIRAREAYLRSHCKGATVPHIDGKALDCLDLLLPSETEQRRIAAILDKADALQAKRRECLAKLDTLTESIFLEMFGDPIACGWRMTTVERVSARSDCAIRTGPFGSQLQRSELTHHGIAVLGIDNVVANDFRWASRRYISEFKYRKLRRYTVFPGDVLITLMGTCGRCAIVPDDVPAAINTKHLCCITLDQARCLPVFLHAYFLRHPIARRYLAQKAKGAIMEGLNMGIIKELPIPLAPMELQHAFAQRVASIARARAAHQQSEAQLEDLFASLQHRAFRGEL
jgi:type I restriction enzyme S subunit